MAHPESPIPQATSLDDALQPDWWETHRTKIFLAFGLAILLIVAWGAFAWVQQKNRLAAEAALAAADSPEALGNLVSQFPGSPQAGAALLLLAIDHVERDRLDEGYAAYQEFLDGFPEHPFAPAAYVSQATILELQGKNQEAIARYQSASTVYPKAYTAPFALLSQARLDRFQGKTESSRTLLENIVTQYPASAFAAEAQALLDAGPAPVIAEISTVAIEAPPAESAPASPEADVPAEATPAEPQTP